MTLLRHGSALAPAALLLSSAVALAGPVEPLGSPVAPAGQRPTLQVKNLDHLAALTKEDPVVHPMALNLVKRSKASWATFGIGFTGGALVSILGMSAFRTTTCETPREGLLLCTDAPNWAMTGAGFGVMAMSTILGLALMPKHDEVLDVLNAWESRRAER
jgi:hypothetical protein